MNGVLMCMNLEVAAIRRVIDIEWFTFRVLSATLEIAGINFSDVDRSCGESLNQVGKFSRKCRRKTSRLFGAFRRLRILWRMLRCKMSQHFCCWCLIDFRRDVRRYVITNKETVLLVQGVSCKTVSISLPPLCH